MDEAPKKQNLVDFFRKHFEMDESKEHLRGQAAEIVTLFHKVLKGYKLYPINNPMFKKFADDFKVKVDLMLTEIPVIPFRIKKTGFVFMKKPVESALEDQEVVYVLFNDGIREIYFAKGITYEEILAFFNILAKVTVYASEDYDIATLIWDANFEHIGYVTEEELIESEPFEYDDFDQGYDLNATENRGLDLAPETFSDREVPFQQNKEIYAISDEEKGIFADQIAKYDETAITARFLKDLSAKLIEGSNPAVREDLVETASQLWERLLMFGAVKESVLFLKTLLKIGAQFRSTNEEFYLKIKNGIADIADEEFLRRLFKAADSFPPEQFPYLGDFLALVPQNLFPFIIETLSALQTTEIRLSALEKLGQAIKNPEMIKPCLAHNEWQVVRNALTVLKGMNNPAVVPLLRPVVNHPEKKVRIEAVEILLTYSVEEALPALEKAVFNPEKEVRLLSVDKLLTLRNPQVKSVINRLLAESNLAKLEPSEVALYLQKIVKEQRQDLYDLIAVLLFSRHPAVRAEALKVIGTVDTTNPIVRHIVKFIDDQNFEKLPKEDLSLFIPLIRPENFDETLPRLEKVLKLSGPLLKRDQFRELKDIVISHLDRFRANPGVKLFFKKGLACGNKETEEIIRSKGGIL